MIEKSISIRWQTVASRDPKKNQKAALAKILSNFSCTPFEINGVKANSIAGFIKGIFFPENDSRREKAFYSWGSNARLSTANLKIYNANLIYWNKKEIPPFTKEHYAVIELAIRAKFEQNKDAKTALISTGNAELLNKEGSESRYNIPPKMFCDILKDILSKLV